MGHHQPHSPGHPVTIKQQLVQTVVTSAAGVHGHTLNQFQGIVRWNPIAVNNVLQRDKHRFPLLRKRESCGRILLERSDPFRQFVLARSLSKIIDLIVAVAAPPIEEESRSEEHTSELQSL